MRVGVLGSGDVGQRLGSGFASLGYEVRMGSRDPSNPRVKEWLAKAGSRASAGTFAEAARFGELAVFAVNWGGVENAIGLAGPGNLAGKVVIDCTNPLDFSSGAPRLAVGFDDSAAERVQRLLPGARVVKAFNIVGNAHMVHPQFPGGPPDMFIAGDDEKAKQEVAGILREFGWGVVDLGGLDASRYLEPLAMIWILHAVRTRTADHAFKLLRK